MNYQFQNPKTTLIMPEKRPMPKASNLVISNTKGVKPEQIVKVYVNTHDARFGIVTRTIGENIYLEEIAEPAHNLIDHFRTIDRVKFNEDEAYI